MAVNPFTGEEDFYVPPAPAAPANLAALQRAGIDEAYVGLAQGAEEAAAARRAQEAEGYGQTRRAWNQGIAQLAATPNAVRGLYRNITGPEGSGDYLLRRAQQTTEQAAEYAPEIQDLSDINGAGDALAYARNALVSNAPTMIPTIAAAAATGGTAGVVLGGARVGAQQAVKKGIASGIARALTPTRAAALGAYAPSVALQANQMVDPALDRTAGGTARERALKATAGAFGTAAIEVLPTVKLLERFGLGDQVKDAVSRSMASRVGRAALGQAGLEGSTEAIQTFGEKATHKWINDNVETLSPSALGDYLNAFVAGGITGGALGAPAGIRDPNAIKTKVKEIERERLGRGQKQPAATLEEPTPASKTKAPADVFGANTAVVESVAKAPADTVGVPPVAPAAPPAAADAVLRPGQAAPAADVGDTFTKIMNDLDVDDAFEGKFSSAWDKAGEFFRTVNTPAFDRNGSVVLNDRGAPVYDKTEIGIDAGGVTRGGVSSNRLFDLEDAEARVAASRAEGRLGMTATQALAASVLGNEQLAGLDKDAIRAAGLYLITGDYKGSSNKQALDTYLDRLSDEQRTAFLYSGLVFADKTAEAREAGLTDEMTVRKLAGSRDPAATFGEVETLEAQDAYEDDPFARDEAPPGLDEGPAPALDRSGREIQPPLLPTNVIRNVLYDDKTVGDLDPAGLRAGGYISVTPSKGPKKSVKLASLVASVMNNGEVKELLGRGDDRTVNAISLVLGELQQKGLEVDIDSIQPGLWLGQPKGAVDAIRLTPAQAKKIRDGWNASLPRKPLPKGPVMVDGKGRLTSGVAKGPLNIQSEEADVIDQPEGQFQGEDPALKPRARSPRMTTRLGGDPREDVGVDPEMVALQKQIEAQDARIAGMRQAKARLERGAETFNDPDGTRTLRVRKRDKDDPRVLEYDKMIATAVTKRNALQGQLRQLGRAGLPPVMRGETIDTEAGDKTGRDNSSYAKVARDVLYAKVAETKDRLTLANGKRNPLSSPAHFLRAIAQLESDGYNTSASKDGLGQGFYSALTNLMDGDNTVINNALDIGAEYAAAQEKAQTQRDDIEADKAFNAALRELTPSAPRDERKIAMGNISAKTGKFIRLSKQQQRMGVRARARKVLGIDRAESAPEPDLSGAAPRALSPEETTLALFDTVERETGAVSPGYLEETVRPPGKTARPAGPRRQRRQAERAAAFAAQQQKDKAETARLDAAANKAMRAKNKVRNDQDAEEIQSALGKDGIAATHDSPYKFDQFNWRLHALKGEGAMVYGAGVYLSTANGVHKHYKELFTAKVKVTKTTPETEAFNDATARMLEAGSTVITRQQEAAAARSVQNTLDTQLKELQYAYRQRDNWAEATSKEAYREFGQEWDAIRHPISDPETYARYQELKIKHSALWTGAGTPMRVPDLNQIAATKKALFAMSKKTARADKAVDAAKAAEKAATIDYENKRQAAVAADARAEKAAAISEEKSPTYQVTVRATDAEIIDFNKPLKEQPYVLSKLKAALSKAPMKKVVDESIFGEWEQIKSRPARPGDDADPDLWRMTVVEADESAGYVYYIKKTERGYEIGGYDSDDIFQSMGAFQTLDEAKALLKPAPDSMVVDSPLASVMLDISNGEQLYNAVVKHYMPKENLYDDYDDTGASDYTKAQIAASEYLQSIGFVGHRYPSAGRGSRNDTQPNYVIYDDSRIETNFVKFDQDATAVANEPNNTDSTVRLKLMLKALSAKLGIAEVVDVVNRKGSFGAYDPRTRRIAINMAKRRGSARIDTVLHEYGHHIISETWKDLPVEAKRAVVKDYVAWRRARRGDTTFNETRASRAPAFIKKWLASRDGKVPYDKLTVDQRKQMLSVHEFMADQLAAALGANTQTQGVVAQFFRRVADMMRAVYNAVSGGAYKPAPSVEAWVQTLINTESARVIHGEADIATQWKLLADAKAGVPVLPPALTPGQGRPGNGGDKPSSLFFALSQEDRGRLLKVLRDRDVYDQIYLQSPQGVKDRLDTYGADMSILVDYAAALFAKGKLKLGASLRSPMRRLLDLVKLALGLPTDRALAEMILNDAKLGKVEGRNGKRYDALARAYRGYYDPADVDENGKPKFRKPTNVGRRVSEFNRSVKRVLGPMYDKLIADAGARMRDTNVPVLVRIAASIEPRTGEKTEDGGYIQGVDSRWQKMMIPYFKSTEKLDTKEKAILNRALQRGRPPKNKKLTVAYAEMRALMDDLYAQANKAGVTFPNRKDFWPLIVDPKAIARDREGFKALLSNPAFEKDIREFFGTIVDKSDPSNPVTKADVDTPIGTLIDRMTLIAETADQSHVGEIDFTDGVKAPAFAHSRRRIMGFIQGLATDAERAKFVKFQQRDLDATVVRYTRSLAKRMEFKARFVEAGVDPVTKKPYTFSKLDLEPNSPLYRQAKAQGATEEDIQQARDLVNMAVGSYKAELNPAIKWVFSKWDALAGTNLADMSVEKWAAVQMGFMTYQNLRLLPLAAFSSFVDPLGVFARGGSQVGSTFGAYKEALGAMKKSNPTQLRQMAEALGIVESHALSDALAATYGGSFDPNGVAGKLNNALFKLNGLEAITRYSRLAALAMGHRFLLQHGTEPTKHSVRLLQELGLKASDIKADPNNVGYVVMNEKTAKALYRFVEESVIRPKPTQRPNWHNDPNFMFVSQYKGYLYSFWNTVPKRMMVELDAGNTTAALLPLLPYFAVTLAAEALRDMLQDDEYKKEQWGPMDYATHAMVRTGVLGPRFGVFNDVKSDAEHGSTVLNSWIGPTGQQITQVAGALAGQRDLTNTAVEALPGSVIYEDWAR